MALLDGLTYLLAEGFWFSKVNYLSIFWARFWTQGGLGLLVLVISLGLLWGNLAIARHRAEPTELVGQPRSRGLRFRGLLLLALALSLTVSTMMVYHGQIAVSHWNPNLSIYGVSDQIPARFQLESLWQVMQQVGLKPWLLGLIGGLAIALLWRPVEGVGAIALATSLGFALTLSEQWPRVLLAFSPTPFNQVDPLFGLDLSFYLFRLPLWNLLAFWLIGLLTLAFVSTCLIYLLADNSLSDGKFLGFTSRQLRHLYAMGGGLMLAVTLSCWLERYDLLYSTRGVVYGASYTDVTATLPAYGVLSGVGLVIGVLLLQRSLVWVHPSLPSLTRAQPRPSLVPLPEFGHAQRVVTWPDTQTPRPRLKHHSVRPLIFSLLGFGLLTGLLINLLPLAVQTLVVQPSELERERPYLERAISLTRNAFNLETIQVSVFDPDYSLTVEDLQNNDLTLNNIRLWDTRPLLDTNRQLQRIRPYYEFPGADIDRYQLPNDSGELANRQVLIAARELDYQSVPVEAQTWINEHLIYTHGYGFTLSPVNTVAEGGLPDYFIQGIEQAVSDERVLDTIPVGRPRIYYGELSNTYVMTPTRVRELDYPSGGDNVYNTYDGDGGIRIGPYWRRLLYAKHLRDWRMLLSEEISADTRLLFRRNIMSRVRAIAPFLRYDQDPYLVVANAGTFGIRDGGSSSSSSNLYWIVDAYTTSDRYPYSDPGGNDFNYIRNSVKVVVDAYHGAVAFYVADASDPIIQSWSRIFPGVFRPLDAMPPALRVHIRYPQDLYSVQADQLMTYHMTDAQVFYNREDQWRAPNEIYGEEQQIVEPYYLIMRLPIGTSEEFLLFRPFAPAQRTNLIAWLAARSDGENYGKMLLYNFPKQELVFGTEQIEARINQDPIISQQISLWNRRGSRAIQGNLLVIPIERSLLYVEPLYLEAEQNRLPILARVIVAYGNRIVMAETLQQGLTAMFSPSGEAPAIVRPLDDGLPTPDDTVLPELEIEGDATLGTEAEPSTP